MTSEEKLVSGNSDRETLVTRRNWATMLAVTTAAMPLVGQVPSTTAPPSNQPAAASSPADDVRKNSDQLTQIEVPMSLEPAFKFFA